MDWLSDSVVTHLRAVICEPDLSHTKYELIEEIGRGGMGIVYLVRDRELGRRVALKVLDPIDSSRDTAARMSTEARILAYLEHPGIVPVHDAGSLPDGRTYYAMKFVQGTRLDSYAATRPPLIELVRVFSRLCEPVAFAHSQGVIHRDLKPENIMTGSFGGVLVLDWGVAKFAGAPLAVGPGGGVTPEQTANGLIIGTRAYMSPEQAAGAVDEIDATSDIYALGKILTFLTDAAGHNTTPRVLRAIAQKAAQPDRALRYASVLDLIGDIEQFLQGQPVSAYRENLIERTTRLLSPHKTLAALAAAYLLMRAVIFLVFRH